MKMFCCLIRSIRLLESRGRRGQEVVLPHERGRGRRDPAAGRRGRVRRRHQQKNRKTFGLLRQKTQVKMSEVQVLFMNKTFC